MMRIDESRKGNWYHGVIVMEYSTVHQMDNHINQNSLMPPLLSYLLLQKVPGVLAHDGHWSRHQSMTFPTQIPSLWRRREPDGCCQSVIPDNRGIQR
jgi:hypothetical protein